jgi:4-methyl-5(b-hydroxyethyl)-thiazole monophosphate biosynthesis
MKRALVLLADGCEEVEALTPVDYLRRSEIEVLVAGLGGGDITGAHDIRIDADLSLDELDEETAAGFDAIVVPGGGKGSTNIAADSDAVSLIKRHFGAGKLVAAICAAPAIVLHGACGILAGRRFTCYPGLEAKVTGASFIAERVVVDGNLITARAAGCAGEFSRAIVEALAGSLIADELSERVLLG